ncbi:MAG: hypothetical protein ABI743_07135 [bacterium]
MKSMQAVIYGLLLVGLLGAGSANAQPAVSSVTPETRETAPTTDNLDDSDLMTGVSDDGHYRIVVHPQSLTWARPGLPFPVIIDVGAVDRPLKATLEVQLANYPLLAKEIDVAPPSQQRVIFTPTWTDASLMGGMGAMGNNTTVDGVLVRLRRGATVLYQQNFPVPSLSADTRLAGEITNAAVILPSFFGGDHTLASPLQGLPLNRIGIEEDYWDYSNGMPQTEATAFGSPMEVAVLDSGGFSDPESYAPFDLLVIHGSDPRSWDAPRIAALQAWVLAGGALLVFPDEGHDWDPGFPVGIGDSRGRVTTEARIAGDASALADLIGLPITGLPIMQRFPLPPGFEPLVISADQLPLVGVRHYGRGAVVMATVDLATPALRGWAGYAPLVSWLTGWALNHSISNQRTPGADAATTMAPYLNAMGMMGSMMGMGGGGGSAIEPMEARLVLPLLHAAGTAEQYTSSLLLSMLTAYVACVLLLFPLLRRWQKWQWIIGIWAGFLLLGLVGPFGNRYALKHQTAEVRIEGPGVPAQVLRGELLATEAGSYDRAVTLDSLATPRPGAAAADASKYPPMPTAQRVYLTSPDYTILPDNPGRIEHVQLPIWSRRVYWDQLGASAEPNQLTVDSLVVKAGDLRLPVHLQNPEFEPDYWWGAIRVGADSAEGLVKRSDRELELVLRPAGIGQWARPLDSREPESRGTLAGNFLPAFGTLDPATRQAAKWTGPEPNRYNFMMDQSYRQDFGSDAPPEADVVAYIAPLREWVAYNGGTAIAALDFPQPGEARPVRVALYYDPTPVVIPDHGESVGFGHVGFVAATEVKLEPNKGPKFTKGQSLEWGMEGIGLPGEQIQIVLAGPKDNAVRLEQYVPGTGWVSCGEPVLSEDPEAVAFERAAPEVLVAGEGLFRLIAQRDLTLRGITRYRHIPTKTAGSS